MSNVNDNNENSTPEESEVNSEEESQSPEEKAESTEEQSASDAPREDAEESADADAPEEEASSEAQASDAPEEDASSEAQASDAPEEDASSEAQASDAEEAPAAPAAAGDETQTETMELDRDDVETVEVDRESQAGEVPEDEALVATGEQETALVASETSEAGEDDGSDDVVADADTEQPVFMPDVHGVAAFFDHPEHLLFAASKARESAFEDFDAYSPFPIHGMDDAMGLGRSWIPWVTFFAGLTGLFTAASLEFGIMGFDWPMIFGGKPYIAWPSFVPVMFELTVLFAGVTTAIVMLAAAGCFRKPFIIDPEITNDRFVLWISAEDDHFDREAVIDFMRGLHPMEIRTIRKES